MNSTRHKAVLFSAAATATLLMFLFADASAQVNRPGRTATPRPAVSPSPRPSNDLPVVISRAEDYDEKETAESAPANPAETPSNVPNSSKIIKDLQERIKLLEAGRRPDPDEKEKRLLLNLEILTKAEQRSESLRKQFFEMLEKENSLQSRLDAIETEIRPESIERAVAGIGSLRPEELRAARRRNLESEKSSLQNLLAEVQRHKNSLELSIARSDALVERLRLKFEADIDSALTSESEPQP